MKLKNILPLPTFLLLLSLQLFSQNPNSGYAHWNLKKELAIEGYDPVSYFQNKPKEGNKEITVSFEGARYYFISESNRALFLENPEKYMPQYGGWCAYAMGVEGSKVKVDPETFKIVEGKLYLFYNFFFNNTLEDWNEDENTLKMQADSNWRQIIGQN